LTLLKDSTNGGFDMLTKKEKAAKMLELEKLDRAFRGLKTMRSLPDMVFIVDGAYEDQVSREATKLGIPVLAMLNTNGDPDLCTDFIPVNTNAVNSLEYIAGVLKDSVKAPKQIERKAGFKRTPSERNISGASKAETTSIKEAMTSKATPVKTPVPNAAEPKAEVKPVEKKAQAVKKTPAVKKETGEV
jgi:small subunit ribosomal protein S2